MMVKKIQNIWHPCSQMKDYEKLLPLPIVKAQGAHFELKNGKKIIDAISSWWCKSLGHNHPRLKCALLKQVEKFEHVILANTTNDTIEKLSEKLSRLTNSLDKVFYASDGSCAVEIALKMSLHARQIEGKNKKTQFLALSNGYHGETVGALSVSDTGLYRYPYKKLLFDTTFLSPIPYVSGSHDPLWCDCSHDWKKVEKLLDPLKDTTTAIILEPIVQGASHMKIYSQDFLKRLRQWTKQHDIHLIADECMTGIGRTGKMLACEHAHIEPDFLCLSKGLTSGWLPLSVVLTRNDIYHIFYDDYEKGKSFLHSHTHSGNALAASIALEVLTIFEETSIHSNTQKSGKLMLKLMKEIGDNTQKINNIRGIGGIVAADLICKDKSRRAGFEVFQKAVTLGAFLRPLGNTIYWLPPLNIEVETLFQLKEITEKTIATVDF